MTKVDQLMDILQRLNKGENPQAVKAEAREFLRTITPADLAIAEQRLVEAGLDKSDLQNLCAVHMEVIGEQLEQHKAQAPAGHVIHTLTSEHEMILQFLSKLQETNEAVQQMDRYDAGREEFGLLSHIAEHLVEAEAHHQREEDVLFPELQRRGVTGPTEIMRLEHQQLRPRKKALKELADAVQTLDFPEFKRRLAELVDFIVPTLRDHIFKEDNILYPTALQVIQDPEVWEQMKVECDRIGYCCFTPEQ